MWCWPNLINMSEFSPDLTDKKHQPSGEQNLVSSECNQTFISLLRHPQSGHDLTIPAINVQKCLPRNSNG
jgi:hypothetical protein